MKVSQEEFTKFWDEVFGRDWYAEEGDVDSDIVDLSESIWVAWQGEGNPRKPPFMTQDEWDLDLDVEVRELFKRWRKAQTHATVKATFEIPTDKLDDFLATLKTLGAVKVLANLPVKEL